MSEGFASKVIALLRKSSMFISEFKSTNSIPTCFAEARAVFAEAILQEISNQWYCGSSRKQFLRGSIRGSCGCDRGSSAEALAELEVCDKPF